MRRALITIMTVLFMFAIGSSTVFAFDINDTGPWRFTSYGYNPKVLNVYTDGVPTSGTNVTLYSWSGSDNQKWYIFPLYGYVYGVPIGSYRISPKSKPTLVLNFNQATTKCTVYDMETDALTDYPVGFVNASGDVVVFLAFDGSRYLGNSSNTNGAQCYWYYLGPNGYIHDEDVWVLALL